MQANMKRKKETERLLWPFKFVIIGLLLHSDAILSLDRQPVQKNFDEHELSMR